MRQGTFCPHCLFIYYDEEGSCLCRLYADLPATKYPTRHSAVTGALEDFRLSNGRLRALVRLLSRPVEDVIDKKGRI